MNNKFKAVFGIGTPCIVLIFVTLCLATVSILSLASTNINYKLAEKSANYTASYYKSDNIVQKKLADINDNYKKGIKFTDEHFDVVINDSQFLQVYVSLHNDVYVISSQKVIIKNDWNYENINE